MACGESCRRLSAGAGITITPDCCGGCVISATGPGAPSGPCTCTLVEDANHPGILVSPGPAPGSYTLGLDPNLVESPAATQQKVNAVREEAQQCCGRVAGDVQTLTDRLNAFPPVPASFLTPEQARQIAEDAIAAALAAHVQQCHTLKTTTTGVTAEEGWAVDRQELREYGGTRFAWIWLKRTGETIASREIDHVGGDGLPNAGNLDPDLLIAKVSGDWIPPGTQLRSAHTGFTSGSVRISTTGDVFLADLTSNNPMRTDQFLVFEYEFAVPSACEGGA